MPDLRRTFALPVLAALAAVMLAPAIASGDAPAAKGPPPKTANRAPVAAPKRVSASQIWHTPPAGKTAPLDPQGRPMLVLQALNTTDRLAITANSERGGFSAPDLDRAAHLLREPRSGNEHPVDPRLLDLVYRVAVHFSAAEVRIISGYRTPRSGSHSNHGRGRAIDLVVPGASDEDVAKFARDQGFVGVGVYPVSGFLHLDVRDRSFFWVDYSGPGKRNRTRGILADLAAKSDARAVARGEHGISPFGLSTDVDAAIAASRAPASSASAVTEDEDADESL